MSAQTAAADFTVCPKCNARYDTSQLSPGKRIQCKYCQTYLVVGRAVDLVDNLLDEAVRVGASDVHIEPLAENLRVRFRIDGVLTPRMTLAKEMQTRILSRIKLLSQADIAERRLHQDGRFKVTVGEGADANEIDVRMSSYITVHGENIVLRILNKRSGILPLADIGLPPRLRRRYMDDALDAASGIVFITGPTGSGKTTTLYSSIDYCNNDSIKISTAEEPVEYQIDGIMQCSINDKIGLTFNETIKALVRQDPDIVVLGEVRDTESAKAAIQIALTGHQVFTTFHAEDAVSALLRLTDMGIEPYLVTSTVNCVIAQRLVRKVCPHCGRDILPSRRIVDTLGIEHKHLAKRRLRKGRGCEQCSHTGYLGRAGLYEALFLDDSVRQGAHDRRPTFEIRSAALAESGFYTLKEAGIVRALTGGTTLEEVWANVPRTVAARQPPELFELTGEPDPVASAEAPPPEEEGPEPV